MATIWRSFTYYIYLFVGAIVVPNWISKIIKRNKEEALTNGVSSSESSINYDSLIDED